MLGFKTCVLDKIHFILNEVCPNLNIRFENIKSFDSLRCTLPRLILIISMMIQGCNMTSSKIYSCIPASKILTDKYIMFDKEYLKRNRNVFNDIVQKNFVKMNDFSASKQTMIKIYIIMSHVIDKWDKWIGIEENIDELVKNCVKIIECFTAIINAPNQKTAPSLLFYIKDCILSMSILHDVFREKKYTNAFDKNTCEIHNIKDLFYFLEAGFCHCLLLEEIVKKNKNLIDVIDSEFGKIPNHILGFKKPDFLNLKNIKNIDIFSAFCILCRFSFTMRKLFIITDIINSSQSETNINIFNSEYLVNILSIPNFLIENLIRFGEHGIKELYYKEKTNIIKATPGNICEFSINEKIRLSYLKEFFAHILFDKLYLYSGQCYILFALNYYSPKTSNGVLKKILSNMTYKKNFNSNLMYFINMLRRLKYNAPHIRELDKIPPFCSISYNERINFFQKEFGVNIVPEKMQDVFSMMAGSVTLKYSPIDKKGNSNLITDDVLILINIFINKYIVDKCTVMQNQEESEKNDLQRNTIIEYIFICIKTIINQNMYNKVSKMDCEIEKDIFDYGLANDSYVTYFISVSLEYLVNMIIEFVTKEEKSKTESDENEKSDGKLKVKDEIFIPSCMDDLKKTQKNAHKQQGRDKFINKTEVSLIIFFFDVISLFNVLNNVVQSNTKLMTTNLSSFRKLFIAKLAKHIDVAHLKWPYIFQDDIVSPDIEKKSTAS